MSQYSIEKDEFLNTNKSIYECFMLADSVTGELNSDYYRAFVNAGYYTPKGRLQTSQQQVTYFSTNIFASGNDFWDNYTANNATIIHLPNESAILMSVANTDTFTIAVASTGTNDVFDTVIRWREAR